MDYLNMIFWATAALLLAAALIAAIISKEYRRELLLTAVVCVVLAVGLYSFFHERAKPNPIEPPSEQAPMQLEGPRPEVSLEPVNPPRWSPFLLFFILLGIAGLLSWRFLSRFWGRREGGLESLADLAGEAAAELRAGAGIRDTVLRCYAEMSELLGKREQIPSGLRKCLTPREFEGLLRRAGVQSEHVARLSRLFEKVRYGGRRTGPEEAGEAISCLEAIQRAYGRETA
jgi:membrane protein implicated in regulation of membrane protease activity